MDAKGKSQAMWGVPNLTLLHEKPKTGAPIWDAIGSDETGLYVNCHAFEEEGRLRVGFDYPRLRHFHFEPLVFR